MINLTQIQEIFAGLYNIYIVESTGVTFDDIILGELQGITLKSGYDYTKIPFTVNTAEFEGKSQLKKIAWKDNSVELFLPGSDSSQMQELTEMDGKTYILLLEDRLNQFWCLGTPEMPLSFFDNYSTGKSGTDSNGHKIIFENESRLMLLSLESSPLDYDTIAIHVNGNVEIGFTTSEPGYVYCRASDGRTFDVYCNLTGTLTVDNFAAGGIVEIYGGYNIIRQIDGQNEGITKIENLNLVPDLYYLGLAYNSLSSIDITALINLYNLALTTNPSLGAITLPETETLEIATLSGTGLSSIDLSKAPNLRYFYLSDNNLTSLDLSVLNLNITTNWIILNNNNFNQAAIDLIISDILDIITITGKAGTLDITNNTAPSAQGLADIATLETTYGWTVTHD